MFQKIGACKIFSTKSNKLKALFWDVSQGQKALMMMLFNGEMQFAGVGLLASFKWSCSHVGWRSHLPGHLMVQQILSFEWYECNRLRKKQADITHLNEVVTCLEKKRKRLNCIYEENHSWEERRVFLFFIFIFMGCALNTLFAKAGSF